MSELNLKENEATMEMQDAATSEEVVAKPYTFRKLSSPDVFPMFKIISLIGVNEFMSCFENDSIKKLIGSFIKKNKDNNEEKDKDSFQMVVGVTMALDIATIILGNISKCESYIYQLLSQTSNLTVDEIKGLDMVVFAEMVIDFIKKEEFKDFIKVVSKLFK